MRQAAKAALEADSIALDAAVAALIAAPVAADAALAAAVLSAAGVTMTVDDVVDGVDGVDGTGVTTAGVDGVTTVVSSFLLQAARAMAATSTASESDLFILSILSF